jgi:hypothetical protein
MAEFNPIDLGRNWTKLGGNFMSQPLTLEIGPNPELLKILETTIGDSLLVITPKTDARPVLIQVVEPFTWAWLGIKLAEGVVAYIGGKLFEAAFFPNTNNETLIRAISEKIDEAVLKLQRYIDEALEAQVVEEQIRTGLALYNSLREHANDPGGTDLKDINVRASVLWSQLYQRGESAFLPACLAASLRSAVLNTRFLEAEKADKKGARANLIGFLDEAIASLSLWKDKIFNRYHVFELSELPLPICHDDPEIDPGPGPKTPAFAEPTFIRRIVHHWSCFTSFRANGSEYRFPNRFDHSVEADAFNEVFNNAHASYDQWVKRRNETEPFVLDNLLIPAETIIAHLREARASLPK